MRGYQKYQKANVEKMSPIRLTIMMYQKCLLNMRWIKENIQSTTTEEADKYYSNTELILYELQLSLDRNENSPIEVKEHVKELDMRYAILLRQLLKMKEKYQPELNNDLIEGFEKLLEGYRSALDGEERNE